MIVFPFSLDVVIKSNVIMVVTCVAVGMAIEAKWRPMGRVVRWFKKA